MLIIIPARGGSKTIRRKNLQPVAGKPLFLHVAATCRQAFPDARIIVSTDDPEIESVALIHGYLIHHRSGYTSSDEATVDDVVFEVVATQPDDDTVLMVQPTVPQITVKQLQDLAIEFEQSGDEAWAVGSEHRHITWTLSLIHI